jgi:hypothetical protein
VVSSEQFSDPGEPVASKKAKAQTNVIKPRIIYEGLDPVSEGVVRAIIQALGDGSPLTVHAGEKSVGDAFLSMTQPIALCASPCDDKAIPGPAAPAPAPKAPAKKAPKAPADKPKKARRKEK